jgi:cytochrome c oxidase subunit 2
MIMKREFIVIAVLLLLVVGVHAQNPAPRVVEISARRFEFTPNVITLKKNEPVTIRLVATDRAHGLLIDALGVDLDASPGQPDEMTLTPQAAGRFAAICDDYCGSGHGSMKMIVVVE